MSLLGIHKAACEPKTMLGTALVHLNSPCPPLWLHAQCQGQVLGVCLLIECNQHCPQIAGVRRQCPAPADGHTLGMGIGIIGKLPVWVVMEVGDNSHRLFDYRWRAVLELP